MRRFGFSMIELLFVIVIMGIISKFGVEFLAQAYKSFIFSNINHNLQANSEMAVESIASRLQYRIKDSVIGRRSDNFFAFESPETIPVADSKKYNILEWVAIDIENYRGDSLPNWSGILDIDNSNANLLDSPETNTTAIDNLIKTLVNSGTGVDDAAIFFIGADSDIKTGYGWDANITAIDAQSGSMHPVSSVAALDKLVPTSGDFGGKTVREYYQLAWTAYAVGIDDYNATTSTGTLKLWYDYQPWKGEDYSTSGNSVVLMDNVSTFQYQAVGSIIRIQVCAKSDLIEEYSLCKEKTIF